MSVMALIKQSDLDRMATIAKKRNVTFECFVDGITIRIHPDYKIPDDTIIDDDDIDL